MTARALKAPYTFFKEYYRAKDIILQLVIRDFQSRYLGSALGLTWAFIQPCFMMGILYAVMRYGLKNQAGLDSETYLAWFFAGMLAWNFFAEVLTNSPSIYLTHAYLIKKVNFRLAVLPFAKMISSLILHAIFFILILVIISVNHGFPGIHLLQLPYFIAAASLLAFGISWLTATVNLFLKDVGQMVGILVQFGFWVTPVIWNEESLPEGLRDWIFLNPFSYVVEGYRASLVEGIWAWEMNPLHSLYFWTLTLALNGLALLVYKRLRPYFGDIV